MVDQAAHVGHHSHVAGNTSLKVLSSKLLKGGNLLHGTRANATTRAGIKLKIRPGHIRVLRNAVPGLYRHRCRLNMWFTEHTRGLVGQGPSIKMYCRS